ncbi:probable LRR receptor-like serine/threonine-protein kinase At1g14390 [Humulus lupulus]|uniref:probable LRR receptor-like serine/threonine-protein kinase At1g14390 n=1 Tax=Humulus lupulus TaxID=3486 RepID=UPI002B40381E|nr:probable LRR receptor-like serine/threonine-protein kinase At1g14390 [Humulus lupulus]
MKNFWVFFFCSFPIIFALLTPISTAQLTPSETRLLFQVQKLLEYPQILQGWTNWTSFCYLPSSPSLKIVCHNNRIIELTIVGNKSSPSHIPKLGSGNLVVSQQSLSKSFSIDSFFTVVTKLSNLRVLSLVSLGLWGPLPGKINRLKSLEVLNLSSNFIYEEIPSSISTIKTLKSLVLADNLFSGSAPDLKSLAFLAELNLGNNHLGPGFPSLGNSLVNIVLTNNSLRSQIPSMLINFDKLQQLDISVNNFVGPIPTFLFSLPSIQSLNLAGNQLSGALSLNITCNAELKLVDLSHNLLIGKLPPCIGSKSINRTVLYTFNCMSSGNARYQRPYAFCHKEALAVKPPAKRKNKESGSKLGLILGIVGGVVGMTAVMGILILIIVRKSDTRNENDQFDKISLRSLPKPNIETRRVPQPMRLASIGLPPYRVFSLEEIEDATNNFDASNLMGQASQGKVYKGRLSDGSVVLVKCLKLKQKHLVQSMIQSIEDSLSKLRHRHLVSVLGHCTVTYQDHPHTATTVFVVLENMTKSLSEYVTDWRKKEMLKWPQRMAITIGLARGVQFLHTGVAPGIYGNKLKINNILLDESLSAKISSYSIPLPYKVGLESPLHGQGVHLDSTENEEKEDIYQLGIILLEVITGKLVISASDLNETKLQLERGLADSKLKDAVEPSIQGSYAYQSLKTAVEISLNCLGKDPNRRPSIEDVLWHLQYAMQVQEGWTSSGNLSSQM